MGRPLGDAARQLCCIPKALPKGLESQAREFNASVGEKWSMRWGCSGI